MASERNSNRPPVPAQGNRQETGLPLRPNVCLIVWKRPDRFLLCHRKGSHNVWQFPQGGAEPEFSFEENAFRELSEEVGLGRETVKLTAVLQATNQYYFENPPPFAVGKWAGQSQRFFLFEFLGEDRQIRFDNQPEPEFTAHCWCTLAEVATKAEPKRVQGYRAALIEVATLLGLPPPQVT